MKVHKELEVYLRSFLISAVVRSEWLASYSGRSNSGVRAPVPIDYEPGSAPGAGLEVLDKRKVFLLSGKGTIPRPSRAKPSHYTV